jgi:UV DNA damage repair endonuclease
MNPEKIRAIKNWAVSTNVKAVRFFIGFANFYRMFIFMYSDIIRPFVNFTKKNKEFHWNEKCNEAFKKLKKLMITDPILAHFHPEKKTILEADSSEYATGGLLLQKNEKG